MAQLTHIVYPDGSTSVSIPFVVGTGTTAGTWLGTLEGLTEYYDGLLILYKSPVAGASTTTLNLNGLGAKTCYVNNSTKLTTHYTANQPILLVYSANTNSGCFVAIDNYWTDSNTVGEYAGSCKAGTNGMARYSLIMQTKQDGNDETWESLVTTSSTATTKAKNTSGFIVGSSVLYQSGGTYAKDSVAGTSDCWSTAYNIDTRYSCNVSSSWSAAGRPFFIKGTIGSDGLFYLADTTWWADAYPTTNDGYYYIYVGQMRDAYRFSLHPTHPIFYFDTALHIYDPSEIPATKSVCGDVVSFKDGAEAPLVDCEVGINPVQDLHGYDSPWVGGAGKNKLNMVDVLPSGSYTENTFNCSSFSNRPTVTLFSEPTTIIFSFKSATFGGSNGRIEFYKGSTLMSSKTLLGTNQSDTIQNVTAIRFNYSSGGALAVEEPMIRLSTETDSTFAPYSNICPISGWDEANVWDDPVYGGNINWNQIFPFDSDNWTSVGLNVEVTNGRIQVSGNASASSTSSLFPARIYNTLKLKYNHIYFLGLKGDWPFSMNFSIFGSTTQSINISNKKSKIFKCFVQNCTDSEFLKTTSSGVSYTADFQTYLVDITEVFGVEKAEEIRQMEIDQAGSGVEYFKNLFPEPYYAHNAGIKNTCVSAVNGNVYKTYTIQLGDTCYGGELDVKRGVLKVDRTSVDLGSVNWTKQEAGGRWYFFTFASNFTNCKTYTSPRTQPLTCSHYKNFHNGESYSDLPEGAIYNAVIANTPIIAIIDTRFTEASDFKTAMNGVQLVYELATPQEIQLTPTQVKSLLKDNNIWADCGSMCVTYMTDKYEGITARTAENAWTVNGHTVNNDVPSNAEFTDTQSDWNATSGKAQILNKPTLGTAAAKDVPTSGNASSTQVVMGNDSRLTDARTPASHTHGNIQNGGTLQTNDITIANGDKLVVTDSSDSSKVARSGITFDGSTTNKALTPKGTFESFTNNEGTITSVFTEPGTPNQGPTITTSGDVSITIPTKTSHLINDTKGIYRCVTDDASTSTDFIVMLDPLNVSSTLYDGMTLIIKNTKVASASGCKLSFNGGAAKPIWLSQSNSACTTHWGLNQTYMFVYDATNDRWELQQGRDTDTTDIVTLRPYYTRFWTPAGTNGIKQYSLFARTLGGYTSISSGSGTGTTKTYDLTQLYDIRKIYYYTGSSNIAAGNYLGNNTASYTQQLVDLRYSLNCAKTLTTNYSLYLIFDKHHNEDPLNYYRLNSAIYTQTPSNTDCIYVLVGVAYDTYRADLLINNPAYTYDGTNLIPYMGDADTVNGYTVETDVPSGAVFTDNSGDDKLPLAGGTTSGDIVVANSNSVSFVSVKSMDATIDTTTNNSVTANTNTGNFLFRGKDDGVVGRINQYLNTNGDSIVGLQAYNKMTNGTDFYNIFNITAKKNGTATYNVTSPENFRAAIGVPYTLDSVDLATDKNLSSGTTLSNLHSFTLQKGLWYINCAVGFAANASGRRYIALSTDGSTAMGFIYVDTRVPVNGIITWCQISAPIYVSEATTIYVIGYQNSGSTLGTKVRVNRLRLSAYDS